VVPGVAIVGCGCVWEGGSVGRAGFEIETLGVGECTISWGIGGGGFKKGVPYDAVA